MDWKSAIAQIKALENTSEPVGVIEAEIARLTNANFEVLKDTRLATNKLRESETKLTDLLTLVGAEGEDLKAKADSASEKVKSLQSELTKVAKERSEFETKFTALETESTGLKRQSLIQKAASKTGSNFDVLFQLTKDLAVEQIAINGDTVEIASTDGSGKKPLREYAEATWSAFVPALFPSTTPSPNNQRLPSGSPTGQGTKEESPLAAYRAGTYDKTINKMQNAPG